MAVRRNRLPGEIVGCRGRGTPLTEEEVAFYRAKRTEYPHMRPCPLAGWKWLVIEVYCPFCEWAKRQ